MRTALILFIILNVSAVFAQKQDYVWLGGIDQVPGNNVVDAYAIDFKEEGATYKHRDFLYGFDTYNASICDKDGNLLFYTNGCAILNSDNSIMENGDSLNYNSWWEWWTNGLGCEYGYVGHEDVLILPTPSIKDHYYLIGKVWIRHGNSQNRTFELHISEIRLDSENGNQVLYKNEKLYESDNLTSSYLTAIPIEGEEGFFVVQPKTNDSTLITYKIDDLGIHRIEDQNLSSYLSKNRSSGTGTAKFSPDGTKYAFYNYFDGLHLYDFDRITGLISNHQHIVIFDSINVADIRFSSVEWSPNSRFIYTASRDELHQVDTWEENIQDGVRLIDIYNGTVDPFPTPFFLMALAPDCRIYIAPTNGTKSYHIINNPNELGTGCNFVQNGVKLPYSSGPASFPNHPRWRVDEEEKCDSTLVSIFGELVYYRSDLDVYPNPSNGIFNIEIPKAEKGLIHVTSIFGEILRTFEVSHGQYQESIDVSNLPASTYNIEYYPLDNKERKVYTRQVVKL